MRRAGALFLAALLAGAAPADARSTGGAPLKVERVVMLIRHGVRAPLDGEVPAGTRTIAAWPRWPVPAGHLTVRGGTAIANQAAAERRWLANFGVMPAGGCPDLGTVRVRSNTAERTVATAAAFVRGFAPDCPLPVAHLAPDAFDPAFEPLRVATTGFDPSAAIADIARFTGGADRLTARHRPALAELNRILGCGDDRCDPGGPSAVTAEPDGRGIALSGPIRTASGTAQVLLLQDLEGMTPVAWGRADAAALRRIGSLHAALFDVFTRPPYMAAAQSRVLMGEMMAALDPAAPQRLTVFVGHDTNVTAIAALLGLPVAAPGYAAGDIPPGGSLVLERLSDDRGRAFVRASFHSQSPATIRSLGGGVRRQVMRLTRCGPTRCAWPAFRAMVTRALAPAAGTTSAR